MELDDDELYRSYESGEDGWYECLTQETAMCLKNNICDKIRKKVLYDIIYSHNCKNFDPDDLECINNKIYYTLDYEKCTLKTDIGDKEIGTYYDSICMEIYVGDITDSEMNPIDATMEDIELITMDQFHNTDITVYFLKLSPFTEEDENYDTKYDNIGKWTGKIHELFSNNDTNE